MAWSWQSRCNAHHRMLSKKVRHVRLCSKLPFPAGAWDSVGRWGVHGRVSYLRNCVVWPCWNSRRFRTSCGQVQSILSCKRMRVYKHDRLRGPFKVEAGLQDWSMRFEISFSCGWAWLPNFGGSRVPITSLSPWRYIIQDNIVLGSLPLECFMDWRLASSGSTRVFVNKVANELTIIDLHLHPWQPQHQSLHSKTLFWALAHNNNGEILPALQFLQWFAGHYCCHDCCYF